MIEKRAGRELAKWVTVTLAVLLGLYVGAYYWLVRSGPVEVLEDQFGLSGDTIGTIIAPIHWLDRRVRPHVWEATP